MAVLPLLADPKGYRANTLDLTADPDARAYWLDVFARHLPSLMTHALDAEGGDDDARRRVQAFGSAFEGVIDRLRDDPAAVGEPLTILRICELREEALRAHGIADPYRPVKDHENAAALRLLPALLDELDAMPEDRRWRAIFGGVFAGNLFDLGATDALRRYEQGNAEFHATRDEVLARPWLVDGFDAWLARLGRGAPHRRAVLLVDNAGADVVLGMLPLARELAKRGTGVVLSANTAPSLNDITHEELKVVLRHVARHDAVVRDALASGGLTPVASGNAWPLIDLKRISEPLASAADGADLLVLEGMGRAVETNYHATFVCETLKLAMLKERALAAYLGGELYDAMCRYEPAQRPAEPTGATS